MLRKTLRCMHGDNIAGLTPAKGKMTPAGPNFGFETSNKTVKDLGPGDFSMGIFDPQWVSPFVGIAETASRRMKKLGIWLVKAADTWCSPYPKELVYRFGRILPLGGKRAKISDNAFIAPNAVVVGEVSVGRKATIGYNAIVRGDTGPVSIGESSCINDKAVVHGPSNIGKWTTIDPLAIIDNADVASCSMVGAASIVMPGARIESNCMLCSASVLRAGAVMPSGEIWSGNPAEKLGTLTEEERGYIIKAAKHMVLLNIEHTATWELTWEEIDNFRIGREHWANWAEHMIEARVKPFYTRAGPRNSGRKHKSPIEIMQGRLDGFGFEGVNETKNKGSDY